MGACVCRVRRVRSALRGCVRGPRRAEEGEAAVSVGRVGAVELGEVDSEEEELG